ncbi:MAG: non-hydrolyzing UDP-N-acetylglucosamine 2-epimerase [Candidatus Hodarchaeota archaeon]
MKVLVIFGTRPEAIKLAPVIIELHRNPKQFDCITCVTAQHRHMLDQVLRIFSIQPHYDLNIMDNSQSLFGISAKALTSLEEVLHKERPNLVMVQGDTTTTFIASLSSFYLQIPIAHVEAGLRTNNKYMPFPEELNRRLTSHLADYHFAPTQLAKKNLLREGIDENRIFVTGNTVVDAVLSILDKINNMEIHIEGLDGIDLERQELILVTGHRRESFGQGFKEICTGIRNIALAHLDVTIIYPVHLNPNVQKPVYEMLGDLPNVHLIKPVDYVSFVYLLSCSQMVLTDSGGIQEEAPSLGKPVLVMRETTERPEAIFAGNSKLVGVNAESIQREVENLLNDRQDSHHMNKLTNPFGDGHASQRIVQALSQIHFSESFK